MKLGVEIINFKITIGRTVFNFSCKTSVFAGMGALFELKNDNFLGNPLKVPSLARSVPKPLKVPTAGTHPAGALWLVPPFSPDLRS